LDDWEVDKDAKVRRRIRSIYNKTDDDFETLLDYQNYEELVEDIIFNLVHGVDREATETTVREYERSNMREIAKKQSRMQDQEHREQELIFQEEARWKQRQLDSKVCLCVCFCMFVY
jgi:CDK-activating kinase assembly factor MAT1